MRNYLTPFVLTLWGTLAFGAVMPSAVLPFEWHTPLIADVPVHFFCQNRQGLPDLTTTYSLSGADTSNTNFHILVFDYSEWDSVYSFQMKRFLSRELPGATLSGFNQLNEVSAGHELDGQQAVILTYPSLGDPVFLKTYGKQLEAFVRQGGLVVITGTHKYDVINHLGLLSVEYASFVEEAALHIKPERHPVLSGMSEEFTLQNNIYPLEISDPAFISIADYQGLPFVGYKSLGSGKIVYLGIEYYFDEPGPIRLLNNIFKWALTPPPVAVQPQPVGKSTVRRSEEVLFAGGGNKNLDLKIYPNPYVQKAVLAFELEKTAFVSVEITAETGVNAGILLPGRTLVPGNYQIDIPDLTPGIYFVHCKIGDTSEVRKIVKAAQK